MFKKRMDKLQNEIIDVPEWEEVEGDTALSGVEVSKCQTDDVNAGGQVILRETYEDVPAASVSTPYCYGSIGVIDFNGNAVNLGDFPALRMAHGEPERVQPEDDLFVELIEDAGEERDLSELIQKYAQMDDEESALQPTENSDDQEELPYLFRNESKEDSFELHSEEVADCLAEEFTMESELALQREISGELLDYIHTINANAEELIRGRDEKYRQSKEARVYDPYNLSFNSRYDDTDEVLSSTPEISMTPKYKLEN